MLYFKNNKVLPRHKINNIEGWKELEYDIPEYDNETHRINKYNFEELETRVIAHAEIIEIVDEEELNEDQI